MTKTNFQMVKEFHQVYGLKDLESPGFPDDDIIDLRFKLIDEEYDEFEEAVEDGVIEEVAKELADLLYVCYGTACAYGIDIDAVFAEVHKSNMSKLDDDGKPVRRDDGKVLKSKNYSPPNIKKVLFPEKESV